MVEGLGCEQQREQLRDRESASAIALHRGRPELRFEAVKRKNPVELTELTFRFSACLMLEYQTDYYPRVPYGERSIA